MTFQKGKKRMDEYMIKTVAKDRRLCEDCTNYIKSRKYCPMIGKVEKPNEYYCSWYRGKGLK